MSAELRSGRRNKQARITREIIVDELKTDAMVHRLGISPRSVKTPIARLYAKRDIHRRVGTAVWVSPE